MRISSYVRKPFLIYLLFYQCGFTAWSSSIDEDSLMIVCTLIKKEDGIFLIYKEIQTGSVAKSYMRKGFLIYEEMRKYLTIYEEAVSHI